MFVGFRGPSWFYGIDSFIEIVLTVIVICLALYGFRAWRLSGERKYLLFFAGFGVIALDFIIHSFTNSFIYFNLFVYDNCRTVCTIKSLLYMFNLCYFIYAVMNLLAYSLLGIIFVKLKHSAYVFMGLFVMFTAILFITKNPFTFNVLALALLVPIIVHAYLNHRQKKSTTSQLVFFAFLLLMLSHIAYFFEAVSRYFYVLGHLGLLAGYALLLLMLILIGRKNA